MKSLFKTMKRVCVGAPTKQQKREIHLAQTDKFSSNHNADKFAPEFERLQQQLADERMHRDRLETTRYEKLSKNLTDIQIAMKELCTKFSIGEIVAPPSPDGEDHFHRAGSRTVSRSASGAIKPYRKSSPVESAGGVGFGVLQQRLDMMMVTLEARADKQEALLVALEEKIERKLEAWMLALERCLDVRDRGVRHQGSERVQRQGQSSDDAHAQGGVPAGERGSNSQKTLRRNRSTREATPVVTMADGTPADTPPPASSPHSMAAAALVHTVQEREFSTLLPEGGGRSPLAAARSMPLAQWSETRAVADERAAWKNPRSLNSPASSSGPPAQGRRQSTVVDDKAADAQQGVLPEQKRTRQASTGPITRRAAREADTVDTTSWHDSHKTDSGLALAGVPQPFRLKPQRQGQREHEAAHEDEAKLKLMTPESAQQDDRHNLLRTRHKVALNDTGSMACEGLGPYDVFPPAHGQDDDQSMARGAARQRMLLRRRSEGRESTGSLDIANQGAEPFAERDSDAVTDAIRAAPANSLPLNFCYERGLPEGAHLMNDVTLVKSPRGQNSHHAQSCIQAPSDKQVGSGRGQTVKDARAAGREGENRSAWRVR